MNTNNMKIDVSKVVDAMNIIMNCYVNMKSGRFTWYEGVKDEVETMLKEMLPPGCGFSAGPGSINITVYSVHLDEIGGKVVWYHQMPYKRLEECNFDLDKTSELAEILIGKVEALLADRARQEGMHEELEDAIRILQTIDPQRPLRWGCDDHVACNAMHRVMRALRLDSPCRGETARMLGSLGLAQVEDFLRSTMMSTNSNRERRVGLIKITMGYDTFTIFEMPIKDMVERIVSHESVDMSCPQAAHINKSIDSQDWVDAYKRIWMGDINHFNPLGRWIASSRDGGKTVMQVDWDVAKSFVTELMQELTSL